MLIHQETDARRVIQTLGLEPHVEGGWFRETWRAPTPAGGRASGTAIYYLLEADQESRWHRVDATEIWHWYAGAALNLMVSKHGDGSDVSVLGPSLKRGQRPQIIVPAHTWQSARTLGSWTLVGCTVSPGFQFSGFELAEDGWEPGPHRSSRKT